MSVTIQHFSNKPEGLARTSEEVAAEDLVEMLKSDLGTDTRYKGRIYIYTNLTIEGYRARDVDMVVTGDVEGIHYPLEYVSNDGKHYTKDTYLHRFCFTIEVKDVINSQIHTDGSKLYVKYHNRDCPVNEESEKQRYTMFNFLNDHLDYKDIPTVNNFIWLRNTQRSEIVTLTREFKRNCLPVRFNMRDLMQIAADQNGGHQTADRYVLGLENTQPTQMYLGNIHRLLTAKHKIPDGLTSKKINYLSQDYITKHVEVKDDAGKRMVIFSGRAGTGKTIKLLQTALVLANPDNGKRALLVTFNLALVSDIRRLLGFMRIPDGLDNYTIEVKTLHSLLHELETELDLEPKIDATKTFEQNYQENFGKLLKFVRENKGRENMQALRELYPKVDWDYILIDESQDWSDEQKEVILSIYGSERVIVANGIDQFRGNDTTMQDFGKGIKDKKVVGSNKELRQLSNLVKFDNEFARVMGYREWKVEMNEKLTGGRIIITDRYTPDKHNALLKDCHEHKCENYDLLILVPPEMVVNDNTHDSHFILSDIYKDLNIKFFDGTNYKNRDRYPTDFEECRIYQYDSCRGLEGWCTVCLRFDVLVQYKFNEFRKAYKINPLVWKSEHQIEEEVWQKVSQWLMIPLTRPVSKLVIVLNDVNSKIGKILHDIANKNKDYITWDCMGTKL